MPLYSFRPGSLPHMLALSTVPHRIHLSLSPFFPLSVTQADSPDTLDTLSEKDIYIIGGIVDRNRYKGLTFDKATGQGLRTAKLPLGDNLAMQGSKVLTVNQVVDIMLAYMELGEWGAACEKAVPQRKKVEGKGVEDTRGGKRQKLEGGGSAKARGTTGAHCSHTTQTRHFNLRRAGSCNAMRCEGAILVLVCLFCIYMTRGLRIYTTAGWRRWRQSRRGGGSHGSPGKRQRRGLCRRSTTRSPPGGCHRGGRCGSISRSRGGG